MIRATIFAVLIASLSFAALAKDKHHNNVLTIDRTVIANSQMSFPNDERIYPKVSDFEVINYVLMSSHNGKRWAAVTLRNNANGMRQFKSDQIMALFGDGDRSEPHSYKCTFGAKQIFTVSLNFGRNKFPMLEVYTRED